MVSMCLQSENFSGIEDLDDDEGFESKASTSKSSISGPVKKRTKFDHDDSPAAKGKSKTKKTKKLKTADTTTTTSTTKKTKKPEKSQKKRKRESSPEI